MQLRMKDGIGVVGDCSMLRRMRLGVMFGEYMPGVTEVIGVTRGRSMSRGVGSSGDLGRYRVVVRPGVCICGTSKFVNRFGGRWC